MIYLLEISFGFPTQCFVVDHIFHHVMIGDQYIDLCELVRLLLLLLLLFIVLIIILFQKRIIMKAMTISIRPSYFVFCKRNKT